MNWFLIGFPLALIFSNIALYKLHHKKIGLKDREAGLTYALSLPTRLFSRAKYLFYLIAICHVTINPLFLNTAPPGPVRLVIGVLMGLLSILLLYASLKAIGANYAPCYTGHLPKELVSSGPYRFFSHPIYLSNVLLYLSFATISFGCIITVLLLALCGFYYFTIRDENKALNAHFSKT